MIRVSPNRQHFFSLRARFEKTSILKGGIKVNNNYYYVAHLKCFYRSLLTYFQILPSLFLVPRQANSINKHEHTHTHTLSLSLFYITATMMTKHTLKYTPSLNNLLFLYSPSWNCFFYFLNFSRRRGLRNFILFLKIMN